MRKPVKSILDVQIVHTLPEDQWRNYVANHPDGNVFHTPEMFQVFARANGNLPTLWAAVDTNGGPLALLLPVQMTLMDGFMRPFTTRAVAYGSALNDNSPKGRQALELLLQTYSQQADKHMLFTELRNLSNLCSMQPVFDKYEFVYEDHLNYLIDLKRTPEAVLQSFGKRTRKKIRRELRKGNVKIEEVDHRQQVATCYNLLRKSYAVARVPLADKSLFEAAFDLLYPLGMVKFYLASIGGESVAGSVELFYKDTIYGWFAGVDRNYSAHVPSEVLMWHILCWGAENGFRLYDFGGAGNPQEEYGVRDFKAKFGGELVSFGRNIHVHSPLRLAISKAGYRFYRNIKKV